MPTLYTAYVEEGATFEQFLWVCARAMDVCVTLREKSLDDSIPEWFEPDPFYISSVAKAEERVAAISALSDDEIVDLQLARNTKVREDNRNRRLKHEETMLKYMEIKKKVEAWQPPTTDHIGLKNFMLEQIELSTRYNSLYQEEEKPVRRAGTWRKEALNNAVFDLTRANDELNKELERVEDRNKWLEQLRRSVPQPQPFKKAS